jgi:hypothetical protein
LKNTHHTLETFAALAIECGYIFINWDSKVFKILKTGEIINTDFYIENNILKNNFNTVLPELIDLCLIGCKVSKHSKKPFKSGDKTGIITGFKINEKDPKQNLAFIIDFDSSVNVNKCILSN